ncbi:MAG TPA: hypothetical protein V6C65_40245 [Allocoleopsis sp.]
MNAQESEIFAIHTVAVDQAAAMLAKLCPPATKQDWLAEIMRGTLTRCKTLNQDDINTIFKAILAAQGVEVVSPAEPIRFESDAGEVFYPSKQDDSNGSEDGGLN